MTVDMTGDAAIVLADFGQSITYTAYGVAGASITAIFSGTSTEVRIYDDGRRTVYVAEVYCSTTDVSSPDKRDTFTVSGTTWQVDDERMTVEDNAGGITLPLIRSSRKEASGPDFRRTL